jgi:hypothetical protein
LAAAICARRIGRGGAAYDFLSCGGDLRRQNAQALNPFSLCRSSPKCWSRIQRYKAFHRPWHSGTVIR